MRWACNRCCRSGLPAKSPCRPSPGAAGGASLRACGTTPIIGQSRPKSLRCACPTRPGRTSSGAKAPTSLCLRALPPRGSGRPRATTNWSAPPSRSNGLSSNGRRARRSRAKYWLSTLPEDMPLAVLVDIIKRRWRIERDYEELKSELSLAHFEGPRLAGFHHRASLCIAAYGFLHPREIGFSPLSPLAPRKTCPFPPFPIPTRPRSVPNATCPTRSRPVRKQLTIALAKSLYRCPCCQAVSTRPAFNQRL